MAETAWTQSTLAAITLHWYVGTTPDRKRVENFGSEGLPWVRVEDMDTDVISGTTEYLTEEGQQTPAVKLVQPGAILVSTAGTIGKIAIAGTTLAMNQAVQALVVDPKVVAPRYVYYYLQFARPQLLKITNHVIIPNLPKTSLQKFPVFYPSLAEQHAIVEQLDRAQLLSSLKKAELARLDDCLLSLFSDCFRDELAGASRIRLDAIADISSGIRVKQSDSDNARPLVNGFGGQELSLRDTASFTKTITPQNFKKYLLRQGDILLRRKLPAPPEPCAILVSGLAESALLGANLIRLRITDASFLPAYLFAWLLLSHRQGSLPMLGNYHTDIDISRTRSILVPVVSVGAQKRFTYYFTQYLQLFNLLTSSDARLESLMQSMLEYAFAGKLTYYWRNKNDIPHPSQTVFNVKPVWTDDDATALYRQNLACLSAAMQAVIGKMSAFQQALLKQLMQTNRPKATHELLGELYAEKRPGFDGAYSIQDAVQAMYVLELLGFVERSELPLEAPGYNSEGVLTEPDGTPIRIQLQMLSRDIFKENSDEASKTMH